MQEAEVRFEIGVMALWGGCCGPEDWVVVGEEGEDYPEEETCCWFVSGELYYGWGDVRQTIRKVKKEPGLKAMLR